MAKRISTLNDHEEHILRRRIHTYQKIHHKEIAEVSSQLEEIRESMKALATDPLYGTHALTAVNHDVSQGGPSKAAPTTQRRKSKLRRTHSFPDLLDESDQGSVRENHSSFPAVKGEIYTGARLVVKSGEKAAFNGAIKARSKSVRSSYHVHDSNPLGKEASDRQEQGEGHKILERSKTAPLTMLQPLLKTTPEMMRKKIHISTSHRLNSEELSTRRGVSPRVGEEGHWTHPTHPQQTQADKGTLLHRPKTVRDSHQLKMNLKPASRSVYESKSPRLSRKDVSAKRVFSRADEKDDTSVKIHISKSSDKGISKPFHNVKEDLFDSDEVSNKEGIEDLRNCRYLRFGKESQESNRI